MDGPAMSLALAFFPSPLSHAHKHWHVANTHKWQMAITACSHKVKLVNQTAIPVETTFLRDMKGLDNKHAAEPIVFPQAHNQDLCWESLQETLPVGWSPLEMYTQQQQRIKAFWRK